ncbi:hypothetical protein PPERSA_02811 [Pseudocohnilembus persalinus]|uniref:Uncharacterized protein n=1 Tax=Pseudocohnilembus persalinus TaxID=266149 RepID=A0A0V0QMZ7_PSEPJ|nr:hypothetical protein PPERSA_02811 [Pseudocohnilembus persalinus]|eukprot:KRX03432.1 hypothetical protein PPERSA_02811 [Pseudocohnilembus persalinus]
MLNLGVNSHQHIPFSNFADDIQNIETESETSMELQDLEEKDNDQNKEQRFKNIRQLLNLNQLQDTQQILNNIKSPTRNRSQINILDQNRQKRIQFEGYNLPKNNQPYLQELRNKRRLSNLSSSSQNNRNKNRSQDQKSKKQLIQEQFQQNQRQNKQQFNFNFKGQNFQVLKNGHL